MGGNGVLSAPPRGGGYVSSTCCRRPAFRSRRAYSLAYETEHLDDRERAWRRVRKSRPLLGSDPDGLGEPPEKPAGMLPSKYAYLLARLAAAEDDLDLPLTLGGPRFAYCPDRNRLRGRP